MNNLVQGEASETASASSDVLQEHPPRRICGDRLKLEHVSLSSPDGTVLVHDLSFEVTAGSSVLLMGPNGSGKTSLVRVLAGLWHIKVSTCGNRGATERHVECLVWHSDDASQMRRLLSVPAILHRFRNLTRSTALS